MAVLKRRTAVLEVRSPSEDRELLALDVQRRYSFVLTIDGRQVAGGDFQSPLGDDAWRAVVQAMREATEGGATRPDAYRRQTETVKSAGRKLFRHLGELAPELRGFLGAEREPRRLVILSRRAEIHQLPWEAMVDDQWKHMAEGDLSVVHALDTFDERPSTVGAPVTVLGLFGPGTERRTLAALQGLAERAKGPSGGRIVVRVPDDLGSTASEDRSAAVVHVEAHGDLESGEIDEGRDDASETPLSDRLQDRSMVLLWSCYSALVHSWGESLGLKLHRQRNTLVLSFATPLRYDTSAELAQGFYAHVFGNGTLEDPETAVVRARARLYGERVRGCEWAALTLWLRSPLDVGETAFNGPRIGFGAAGSDRIAPADRDLVARAVRDAVPGRPTLVRSLDLGDAIPADLAEGCRGAAVSIRAGEEPEGLAEACAALGAKASSPHRGDLLLAVLDALAGRPDSMLLWTGVTVREVWAVQLLGPQAGRARIVLVSPWPLGAFTGFAILDGGRPRQDVGMPGADEVTRVEELTDSAGAHREALEEAERLRRDAGLPAEQRGRLEAACYWAAARLGEYDEAEACLRRLEERDAFEGLFLRANLVRRRGRHAEARSLLSQALSAAQSARDRARVQIELGDLAAAVDDAVLADRLFAQGISSLSSVEDGAKDPRWRTALGRGLRDWGHLLASRSDRADEAASLLRRALAVNALDGRLSQVGAALSSRGVFEGSRGRWDEAEEAIATAASVATWSNNLLAWALAVREMAEMALTAGRLDLALALATGALGRLRGEERKYLTAVGRLWLLAAQVHWRKGALAAAHEAARSALQHLPPDRTRDCQAASGIAELCGALAPPAPPAPKAARRSARLTSPSVRRRSAHLQRKGRGRG